MCVCVVFYCGNVQITDNLPFFEMYIQGINHINSVQPTPLWEVTDKWVQSFHLA